jgi:hypothetical protein
MSCFASATRVNSGRAATALLALAVVVFPTHAQSNDSAAAGRVAFDLADAPAATVEVDLTEGLLSAFTGVAKAAIEGVAEALLESSEGRSDAILQSAEHLQAVDAIVETLRNVVREVRVRVYEHGSEETQSTRAAMVEHYQKKLAGTHWESVVRVQEGDGNVVVFALQDAGTIHGLFTIVSEPDDLVIANVVCDLTPENVKQVTSQATKIGMKVGLEKLIEQAMEQIHKGSR